MEPSLYRSGRTCVRNMMVLIGAGVIAVSAVPQGAAAQTQEWHDREFQSGVFGEDNAVDVVYWSDPATSDEWVYVTGYHALANGATVFATSKYLATFTGPGENNPFIPTVFYPALETDPTGTHRAVAVDIDPATGDVYVTGESNRADDETGFDFVIIKYDKNLVVDITWKVNSLNNDGAIRWNNKLFNGDDRPVDIALADDSQVPSATNVVGITGTSYTGPNGLDIKTIMLEADTGNYFADWSSASQLNPRTRQGDAGGDDRPVGIRAYWTAAPLQSGEPTLHAVVAGTLSQVHGVQINDDIWTTEYDIDGNTTWEEVYNGPANGDDAATAMDVEKFVSVVFVCGSTTSAAGDTDYIAVGYELGSSTPSRAWFGWPGVASPNVAGVRVYNGPGPNALRSDDSAVDIAISFFDSEVWLTGTVREADGVGYDTGTIRYGLFGAGAIPGQEVVVGLSQTTERAVALDINDDALAAHRGIFVAGTIKGDGENDTPLIQTFKIISGTATVPAWIRLFGYAVTDTPAAIIAPGRDNGTASIYVFGQSFLFGSSHDQVGVHYTQP